MAGSHGSHNDHAAHGHDDHGHAHGHSHHRPVIPDWIKAIFFSILTGAFLYFVFWGEGRAVQHAGRHVVEATSGRTDE